MFRVRPWWLAWVGRGRWVTIYPHIYHPKDVRPEAEEAMAFKHELKYCIDDAHRAHVVKQAARQLAWFNYWFAAWTKAQARRAIEQG